MDVLDGVTALVHQSLLQRAAEPDGAPRFAMLETVREYAAERLAASGEEPAVRGAHAAYCVALVECLRPGFSAPTTPAVARLVAAERPNLRAALAWEADRGRTDLLLRLVDAEWWVFWEPADGFRWLERGVAATADAPPERRGQRARLLAATAYCALWRTDFARVAALADEALALAREADEPRAVALAVHCRGAVAAGQGDLDRALALETEALRRWRALPGSGWGAGEALFFLGMIADRRGEPERAEAFFAEALAVARAVGSDWRIARALVALGNIALDRGDPRRAAALLAEGLTLVREGTDPLVLVNGVTGLGQVAAAVDEAERAARLYGAAVAWRDRFGFAWSTAARLSLDRAIAAVRARLPATAFAAAWAAGQALPLERAVAEALAVAALLAAPAAPARPPTAAGLTARELEVLRLVAAGYANREIADRLSLSERTVEHHVLHIRTKLDLPSRVALATYAVTNGLV